MDITHILQNEVKGSIDFFLDHTNLEEASPGYGLTVDSSKKPNVASIASTGFALTAWVIASEHGFISAKKGRDLTRRTLATLLKIASHYHGFFAHYLLLQSGERFRKCEYSTIDTALCLNGVITAEAYFRDAEITDLASQLLNRVDWQHFVFEKNGSTLFHMAYNPDEHGDYVDGKPGFISQWNMAAEQKVMYLQAAGYLDPDLARKLYQGFSRDAGEYDGQKIIINPGGNLFAYLFSEAWLDTARYLDPDGINWFNNTRLAALANHTFCIEHSHEFKTFHTNSWGSSCGDGPRGYEVAGSTPSLFEPRTKGTVSIYSALGCLPFIPELTKEMILFLYQNHTETWGKYGFFDSYNLDVTPPWFSRAIYGIDKGCSMIMIENYLSGLIWNTYTNSPIIQKALAVLGFHRRSEEVYG